MWYAINERTHKKRRLKDLLYKFISVFAQLIPINLLIRLSGINTIYPFYHAVSDSVPVHLKHLYSVPTKRRFRKDIQFLIKHFTPINFVQSDLYSNEKASFLLSFDDGLSEVRDFILPILDEFNIKAVFFINSAFADNTNLFFKNKASILIEKIQSNTLDTEQINKARQLLKFHKRATFSQIKKKILHIAYSESSLLDQLSKIFEINFSEYLTHNKPYLTIQDLKDLPTTGHLIGAHSVDHPLFSEISIKEQISQVKDSIEFIQNKIDQELSLFAFPFTDHLVKLEFFDTIKNNNITDFTFGTAGIKLDTAQNNIQRIPIELHGMSAKRTIKTEYFLYILKRIIGKHKISRD